MLLEVMRDMLSYVTCAIMCGKNEIEIHRILMDGLPLKLNFRNAVFVTCEIYITQKVFYMYALVLSRGLAS